MQANLSNQSQRFTLNKQDLMVWGKMTLAFFAPVIIIFFQALVDGKSVHEALTPAIYSLYASIVYLAKRFQDQ